MSIPLVALGEILIDFTPAGLSPAGHPLFEQNPGGAPANVLAAAGKQGVKGALLSCVGDDMFGRTLIEVCKENGIDPDGIQVTDKAATTLAFVSLDARGDRSFAFARKPGADMLLEASQIDVSLLQNCSLFHFGSLSLCAEPSRTASLFAAKTAKEGGALCSYDPNWRPALWPSEAAGIAAMREGLAYAGLCKLSEEELALLSGVASLEEGTSVLNLAYPALRLIVVTRGPGGCFYRLGEQTGCLPTYDTKIIDTTGAGDAFWGVFLSELYACPAMLDGDSAALERALDRANAAGALCASGRGAIASMPAPSQIDALLETKNLLIL